MRSERFGALSDFGPGTDAHIAKTIVSGKALRKKMLQALNPVGFHGDYILQGLESLPPRLAREYRSPLPA